MAVYVLVHGAWHGGWCWKRVSRLLRNRDHDVFTPTLTGLGERAHLSSPDISLSTHVQDIVNVLEYEELDQVILVGHSFAGMVITGVADRCAGRIAHLVYLDAVVPKNGESFLDCTPPWTTFRERVRNSQNGFLVPSSVEKPFGITSLSDAVWVKQKLVSHPIKTMTDALPLFNLSTSHITRTYIYCSADKIGRELPVAVKRFVKSDEWQFIDLATGHDAMITAPNDLVSVLLNLP